MDAASLDGRECGVFDVPSVCRWPGRPASPRSSGFHRCSDTSMEGAGALGNTLKNTTEAPVSVRALCRRGPYGVALLRAAQRVGGTARSCRWAWTFAIAIGVGAAGRRHCLCGSTCVGGGRHPDREGGTAGDQALAYVSVAHVSVRGSTHIDSGLSRLGGRDGRPVRDRGHGPGTGRARCAIEVPCE